MSEYKNGRILLSSSAAKVFSERLNHPSDEVTEHRREFLDNIKKSIHFISSDTNEVIAEIIDFDDSFLDIVNDQPTTWRFCYDFQVNLSDPEDILLSSVNYSHTASIALPPSPDNESFFSTFSDPYYQSCA